MADPFAWLSSGISHGYITSSQGGDTPHYADDIPTPFHTPITALWSGTVEQADYAVWGGQPGGGEVFVKIDNPKGLPANQYYVYHLDQLNVTAGQHVNAGQVLGLSGGQNSGGSHPVSPMWSSGAHTHVGFFDGYINTPIGSRPHGPDITPYLKQAQASGGSSSWWSAVAAGSVAASTGSAAAGSAAGTDVGSIISQFSQNWQQTIVNWGEHIAVFALAMLIIIAGFAVLFHKQIGEVVQTATQDAIKGGEEAVMA